MIKYFCISLVLLSFICKAQEVQLFSERFNQYQNVRDFCITQSGDEAYLTVQSPNQELSQIVCIKKSTTGWGEPQLLPFCNRFMYLEPFLYNDNILYFVSNRPLSDGDSLKKDFDIWYVTRSDKQITWSNPVNVGGRVNSKNDEFYPSLSKNKNLYFTMDSPQGIGKDDIYYCKWNGNSYEPPLLLNHAINSEGHEFNAFISGDESMLIYTQYNAKDGLGSGDLYISRKDALGNWKPAGNMGKSINSKYMDYCPYYDELHGQLYFTSKRSDLKAQKFEDFNSFQHYISGGMNGMSRIYTIKIKID